MKIIDQYMPLNEDETISSSLEGNAYTKSSNIFTRIFSLIERIIAIILGMPRKVYIFVTNTRVIVVETRKIFWFIDSSVSARSFSPSSISLIGYRLNRHLLIFQSHYLEFGSKDNSYNVKSKDGRAKVYQVIDKLTSLSQMETQK